MGTCSLYCKAKNTNVASLDHLPPAERKRSIRTDVSAMSQTAWGSKVKSRLCWKMGANPLDDTSCTAQTTKLKTRRSKLQRLGFTVSSSKKFKGRLLKLTKSSLCRSPTWLCSVLHPYNWSQSESLKQMPGKGQPTKGSLPALFQIWLVLSVHFTNVSSENLIGILGRYAPKSHRSSQRRACSSAVIEMVKRTSQRPNCRSHCISWLLGSGCRSCCVWHMSKTIRSRLRMPENLLENRVSVAKSKYLPQAVLPWNSGASLFEATNRYT